MGRASTASFGTALLFVSLVTACGGATVQPTAQDPRAILLEGTTGNRFVRAGQPTEMVAHLKIRTRALSGIPRPKINLALVIDTSGSMEGKPIDDARRASLAMIDSLAEGDRLAVIAFNSETETLLPSTVLDAENLTRVEAKVRAMRARGTTDLAGGLRVGLEEVMRNFQADGINRLVLLGDGVPNDPSPVRALAQAAGERGIAITALGLGLDYDETLMGQIAQLSRGSFHYIDDSSRVAGVFQHEVLRIERVVGRNAIVEVRPGPGVHIQSVVGRVLSAGERVQVTLGDISEGEQAELIVRMTVDGRRAGASVELLDAILSFEDGVASAGHLERRVYLSAKSSADDAQIAGGRNQAVERAAARMQAAAVVVQAIEMARSGELDQARATLDRAAAEARQSATSYSDGDLDRRARSMSALSGALGSVAPQPAAPPQPTNAAPAATYDFAEDATTVRSSHDEAMRTLIGH